MSVGIAPARQVTFRILRDVVRNQGNSDTLLHSHSVDVLSAVDRNLCTTLVMGTLRWQRILDAKCRQFLSRPNQVLPEDALLALRMGAYQLLFLDRIPVHAAIFESVEWTKQSEAARQAGLVNAVLRKVAVLPKFDQMDAEFAYPEWMVTRWRNFYGDDACRQICEAGQQEPRTTLRLLTPDAEAALHTVANPLENGAFLSKARYGKLPENSVPMGTQFQDEGSQLVAELVGQGSRILDCCAAPGGKTAVISANNPEAQLMACDIQSGRLAAMQQRLNANLPQAHVEYRAMDAAKLENIGSFDRILCDVPCTGTGTLARNPEIRHRLRPEELARQAARQRDILNAALHHLSPGGRLVYATCSLEPEENEEVVAECLKSLQDSFRLKKLDLRMEFDRLKQQGTVQGDGVAHLRETGFRNGFLRTLPGVHSCDGFFAALIERS